MKTIYNAQRFSFILIMTLMCGINVSFSQTIEADFEDLTLAPNSYENGSTLSGTFTSNYITFRNTFDWGYWLGGFAYSNQGDTAVSPSDYMTQMYQTKAGVGNDSSANFGIGQQGAKLSFYNDSATAIVNGLYITNTTYAYNSMALGDAFGKKFGDTSSTVHSAPGVNQGYPDWFRLDIFGYIGGVATLDTVHFYLADFRFSNDSLDYIVKDWTYVDLSSLGYVDSVQFVLNSSDIGGFGINTPTYFCVDNVNATLIVTGLDEVAQALSMNVYPNPFSDKLNLNFETSANRTVSIYTMLGGLVSSEMMNGMSGELNMEELSSGMYIVKVIEGAKVSTVRVTKK